MDEAMKGTKDRVLFYDDEEEKGYRPNLCFLDCHALRHPRHKIVERSLLHHHHHHRVEKSRQEDGGGPIARAWLWPSREISANDDGYSSKGVTALSRWKQAFFLITRRINTAGAGRSAPPTRTAQFLYNPQSYAFNFETESRSARFVGFAQRYAPPENIKEKKAPMKSQIPGVVQPL